MERQVPTLDASLGEIEGTLDRLGLQLRRTHERLREVELALAEVKGRTSQLPTVAQMFTCMGALLAFVVALFGSALVIAWSLAGY